MPSARAPFAERAAFEALDADARRALAAPLAESLGKDFRARPELVGTAGMVCVEHVPSGLELVAVPGGRFDMGLTERDREAIARCVDPESSEVQDWLRRIAAWCLPAHPVEVSPFLLSRTILASHQVAAIGGPHTDCFSIDAAASFATQATLFRLPSEAELEYTGREGGVLSFLNDSGRIWSTTRRWPHENAWGFRELADAVWAADEWHDDYEGAPATSAPWTTGGPPGVYRGCLMEPPRNEAELLFALAACRGRLLKHKPEDEWPVALRVAMSMAS